LLQALLLQLVLLLTIVTLRPAGLLVTGAIASLPSLPRAGSLVLLLPGIIFPSALLVSYRTLLLLLKQDIVLLSSLWALDLPTFLCLTDLLLTLFFLLLHLATLLVLTPSILLLHLLHTLLLLLAPLLLLRLTLLPQLLLLGLTLLLLLALLSLLCLALLRLSLPPLLLLGLALFLFRALIVLLSLHLLPLQMAAAVTLGVHLAGKTDQRDSANCKRQTKLLKILCFHVIPF